MIPASGCSAGAPPTRLRDGSPAPRRWQTQLSKTSTARCLRWARGTWNSSCTAWSAVPPSFWNAPSHARRECCGRLPGGGTRRGKHDERRVFFVSDVAICCVGFVLQKSIVHRFRSRRESFGWFGKHCPICRFKALRECTEGCQGTVSDR